MRYEVRVLNEEDAKAFLQNMRWFANIGSVKSEPVGSNKCRVRASVIAWSYWVG